MTAEDANSLLRVRRNRAQGLALVLDVDTFAEQPAGERVRAEHELATKILRDNQWRVDRGPARDERRRGLGRARPAGGGGLMRATDRLIVAVVVAVFLAGFTLTPLTVDNSFLARAGS